MKRGKYVETLWKIFKEIVPNEHITGSIEELERFQRIVQQFIELQGNTEMSKYGGIRKELSELLEEIKRVCKANVLDKELEDLKNGEDKHNKLVTQLSKIKDLTPLAREKLLKILENENGINLGDCSNLGDYTKRQIQLWAKFLSEHHIDLKVCGPDDTCYLMKYLLYDIQNLTKTKKQIDTFNNVKMRSKINRA